MARALALALPLLLAGAAHAQGIEYLRTNYTKYEHAIPMRDGKRLHTAVYVPKDTSKTYPVLLVRTPYSVEPYGDDNYPTSMVAPEPMVRDGYILAWQDVRGRFRSEGEFVHVRPIVRGGVDESTDTWDTIDWLVKHVPGNNGRVGMWGISYPGFYASAGLVGAHPALKAVSPQAPVTDWFIGDDFRHNGAFFLAHAFGFFPEIARFRLDTLRVKQRFDHGTIDGYEYFLGLGPLAALGPTVLGAEDAFWTEALEHDTYDDYWKARNIRPHLKDVRPAVMTVGGWFDAEDLFGALEVYRAVERQSPGARNLLVMGPWIHGGWVRTNGDGLGCVRFNANTSDFFVEKIMAPFFRYHLKGGPDPKLPEAYVFETGRNQWRRHEVWPPRGARSRALVFQDGGGLAFDAAAAPGADEYVSDPARPVPTFEDIAIHMLPEYMVGDQRFAARRPDVLVYQTAPLADDVTIAGPIQASLQVSTTGTDADFVVKLIDVYPADFPDPPALSAPATGRRPLPPCPLPPPEHSEHFPPLYSKMGGYQQLVRGEPFRGRFRQGFERPVAFVPGERVAVAFNLPDAYHTFRRGHRIMVQVQSSWFPLVDRNPQAFVSIAKAAAGDYRKATMRVYRDGLKGSQVKVMVVQ